MYIDSYHSTVSNSRWIRAITYLRSMPLCVVRKRSTTHETAATLPNNSRILESNNQQAKARSMIFSSKIKSLQKSQNFSTCSKNAKRVLI